MSHGVPKSKLKSQHVESLTSHVFSLFQTTPLARQFCLAFLPSWTKPQPNIGWQHLKGEVPKQCEVVLCFYFLVI